MHPVFYIILEFFTTVLVIGFTSSHSSVRLGGLLVSIFCVVQCIPLCMLYMRRTPWAALVGGCSVTCLYQYLDVAILNRWTFEHGCPVNDLVQPTIQAPPKPNGSDTMFRRLVFGLKVTSSYRFVGTPYQVQNVPRYSTTNRRMYFQCTFLTIVTSYIVLDFISSGNDLDIAARHLTLDKVPIITRLIEVTAEEVFIRLFTVLAAATSLHCVQGGVYYIVSVLVVSLGVSSPAEWPPFYGSPREVYTLRRFWSVFWHQTNTQKFSSISHYVVHQVLGLFRGTTIARYLRILTAFSASGVMHLLIDLCSGISLRNSGAMKTFLAQALGLIMEDIAMNIYQRLPKHARLPVYLEKALGVTWVALFLTWSVPAYIYPMMWRSNQGLTDSTIPFSIFGANAEPGKAMGLFLILGCVSLLGVANDSD